MTKKERAANEEIIEAFIALSERLEKKHKARIVYNVDAITFS